MLSNDIRLRWRPPAIADAPFSPTLPDRLYSGPRRPGRGAMRVSVVQMNQGSDKAANLDQARRLVEAAIAADRPDLVSLPETWTNLGGGRDARLAAVEALPPRGSGEAGGEAYEMMRGLARRHGIHVHGGSIIEA